MKPRPSPFERGPVERRRFLQHAATSALAGLTGLPWLGSQAKAKPPKSQPAVHTVLGPVSPEKIGVTLMHEHAPIVDWSELFETQPAPVAGLTSGVADVAVGFFHICALRTSGAVTCLGLSDGAAGLAVASHRAAAAA